MEINVFCEVFSVKKKPRGKKAEEKKEITKNLLAEKFMDKRNRAISLFVCIIIGTFHRDNIIALFCIIDWCFYY